MIEEELYRENIIDHYRHPRNKTALAQATFSHQEKNPLCGDEITLFVELAGGKFAEDKLAEHKVVRASFLGQGCAISQASVSLLTEYLEGKSLSEVKQLTQKDIFSLLGVAVSPGRVACAVLSLKALHKGIEKVIRKLKPIP